MSLLHPRFSHSHTGRSDFPSLFRVIDDFDRYAQQHLQLGSTQGDTSITSFSPKFDVAEQEKEYVLQGELPGVKPENVEIEFTDDQTLVVRGHSERKHTEGDRSLLEGPQETKKVQGGGKQDTSVSKGKEGKEEGTGEGKTTPRYWLSERSYGEFSRVFSFPAAVDQDKVQARFKDGVLDIKVPKAEKRGGKKITIE
jgi:HSP20 family molecular chaperone IbpA